MSEVEIGVEPEIDGKAPGEDQETISRDDLLKMRDQVRDVFYGVAGEVQDLLVADGGRTLQSRHRINAMKIHLSPCEMRHEKAVRALLGMIAVQGQEIVELQGVLSSLVERVKTREAVDSEADGREAGTTGVSVSDGVEERSDERDPS